MIYTTRQHDIETGEWVVGGRASPTKNNVDSCRLQIHERIKIFYGEVWFDSGAGFPWKSVIDSRGKNAESLMKNLLSENMAAISGISSFELIDYTYNAQTRRFTIRYTCVIEDYGEISGEATI